MGNEGLCRRVGIDLTDYQASVVRYHASVESKDPEIPKDSKELTTLGSLVINCAYATYLYIEEGVSDGGDLSKRINGFAKLAANSIYERLSLKEFVVLGESEIREPRSKRYSDVSLKLVATIYAGQGFLGAYEFLRPYYTHSSLARKEPNYKGLVQEYAQARRMSFSYRIIGMTGPDHAPLYTCELSVGKEKARGTGTGKKRSEFEAAKEYVKRHGIATANPEANQSPKTSQKDDSRIPVTKERQRQLSEVVKALGIKAGYLSAHEMDVALTHSDYRTEDPNVISNEGLKCLGSYVINLLAFDYVYRSFEISTISTINCSVISIALTSEGRLGRLAPTILWTALRKGSSLQAEKRDAVIVPLKAGVIRAIVAQLWVGYCTKSDESCADAARELVRHFADMKDDTVLGSSTSMVQQLVNAYRFKQEYGPFEQRGPVHEATYHVVSVVTGPGWRIRATGKGKTKKDARSNANELLLNNILGRCPIDETTESIRMRSKPIHDLLIPRKFPARIFMSQEQLGLTSRGGQVIAHPPFADEDESTNKPTVDKAMDIEAVASPQGETDRGLGEKSPELEDSDATARGGIPTEEEKDREPSHEDEDAIEEDELSGDSDDGGNETKPRDDASGDTSSYVVKDVNTLYVCKRSYDCRRRGHQLSPCDWTLQSLSGDVVTIEAEHCEECGVTLVGYDRYHICRKNVGPLVGSHTIIGRWYFGRPEIEGNECDPKLSLYGYGVSEALGYTDESRKALLSSIVDRCGVSRAEAEGYLSYCIAKNSGKAYMRHAVERWSEDLKWLRDRPSKAARDAVAVGSLGGER